MTESTEPTAPSASSKTFDRTEVVIVAPFGPTGVSDPSYTVKKAGSGSCWTGSLKTERPDAWRCSVGNLIRDPCFSSETIATDFVLCLDVPWSTTAENVRLEEELPSEMANSELDTQRTEPWGLELVDGQRCGLMGGATTTLAGHRLNYGCQQGYVVGDLDRSTPAWTALYGADEASSVRAEPVRRVWF